MSRVFTLSFVVGCFIASALLTGCRDNQSDPWNGTEKLKVVTTFAPLHCFAMNVAPDAEVRSLLTSQGPHHADPPTGQARMLAKADYLFANGLQVDDGIVRKMSAAMGRGGPTVVKLGGELPKDMLLQGTGHCCDDHDHDHHHDPNHVHYDGHVWLGIDQAKRMVMALGETLDRTHRPHAPPTHAQRAQLYADKLDALHAEGLEMLKGKTERTILPFHGSLAYFAKSFNLELIDPIQEVPGSEPTAKHLEEIVEKCLKHEVRLIAVEPQYGAETSAKAVLDALRQRGVADAAIIVIDPLETAVDREFGPDWYERKMRENLETLAKSLR